MFKNVFHSDHGVDLNWLCEKLGAREGFYIEVVELDPELPAVDCGLYGPSEGDAPVDETEVSYVIRGKRNCASRVVNRPPRPARFVVAIGLGDTLFTAYGSIKGHVASREPGDTSIDSWEDVVAARKFWATHALCA